MTTNRRIVFNIIATYGRSLYALLVGLVTARWALEALGQVDYGVYGVIGGLTVFISFFNGILGGAISRFYAIAVGQAQADPKKGLEECRMWFTTAVLIHSVLPIFLMVVGYPLGVWTVRHVLTIPIDRVMEGVWVWRFVCVTCFLGMVSIPMNAMYAAKQYIAELTIYSFVTTTLNALFLYYMVTHPGVWLAKYAFWMCLLSVLPNVIIAARAFKLFDECRFRWEYVNCWANIRKLGGYALWNAWGTFGAMLRDQGQAVLVNLNFGPLVNAGMSIGNNLSGHCNTLSGSLIGAFSPAIFNAWGAGRFEEARRLAYRTCKFGTLFVVIFAIPLVLEIDEILLLWLKTPPKYAAGFCMFVLAMDLVNKMAVGHMLAVNANGRIALYQMFLGTSLVMAFPLGWALIHLGVGPYSIGWAMVVTMCVCAGGRVLFARRLVGMSAWYWVKHVAVPIFSVCVLCLAVGCLPKFMMEPSVARILVTTVLVECLLIPFAWYLILDSQERKFVSERVEKAFSKFGRKRDAEPLLTR